jgi:hypothetical protein
MQVPGKDNELPFRLLIIRGWVVPQWYMRWLVETAAVEPTWKTPQNRLHVMNIVMATPNRISVAGILSPGCQAISVTASGKGRTNDDQVAVRVRTDTPGPVHEYIGRWWAQISGVISEHTNGVSG